MPGRELLEVAASVGRTLRPAHAEKLGTACASASSAAEAQHLVSLVPTPAFRQSAQRLIDAWKEHPGVPGIAVGAAVAAAAHAHDDARRTAHVELVVSGPTSSVIHARRTEQVLLQLIGESQREILLVTYALQMHEALRDALAAALARGVQVTVLAEDPADSNGFLGDPTKALSGLVVRRLRWCGDQRPAAGAALHGKAVVIDTQTALITSANLTKRAAGDNLEIGVLIRGGDIPRRLAGHVEQLLEQRILSKA